MVSRSTLVLVHGAWHGGWCWGPVAALLRAEGHLVLTPTLSGLGERAHRLTPEIDLGVMVEDVVAHIVYEDLFEVRLVGHSFGGPIISGVANQMPERIADLTFLDALWLDDGIAPIALLTEEVQQKRLAAAEAFDGGLSFPVPAAAAFGVTTPEGKAFLSGRLTPHPVASYLSPLAAPAGPTGGLPARYVVCTEPLYGPVAGSRAAARATGVPLVELAAPHDAMVTHPEATARTLMLA